MASSVMRSRRGPRETVLRDPEPGAGPQANAVVVLSRWDDVAGTGAVEQRHEVIRIEPLGVPRIDEFVVRRISVQQPVVLCRRAAGDLQRIPIPLGVRVRCIPLAIGNRPVLAARFCRAWDRVRPPMNEDAELGVSEPRGGLAAESIPVWFSRSRSRRRTRLGHRCVRRPSTNARIVTSISPDRTARVSRIPTRHVTSRTNSVSSRSCSCRQ